MDEENLWDFEEDHFVFLRLTKNIDREQFSNYFKIEDKAHM